MAHHTSASEAVRDALPAEARPQHEGSVARGSQWWRIRLFHGMINDIRRRAPYYWSDWKDAWDYRVVPATVYMYFAKYVLFVSPAPGR